MSFNRSLFIILSGLFIIMVGFGITLPVLPYFIQRLSISEGVSSQHVLFHIGLLTGIFALMQFLFSPMFGLLSDRKGRKPLIVFGLAGYSVSLLLFSIATSLWLLYFSRIIGGILSSAFLTSSIAYIADVTPQNKRGRGMSLLGSFIGLGLVAGPLIGSFFSDINLHFNYSWYHFNIDKYSTPFIISSIFTIAVLISTILFLPESKKASTAKVKILLNLKDYFNNYKWSVKETLFVFLLLSFISQFSLAMFEGTFAIHSQRLYQFGLKQISIIFMVCGGVMGLLQLGPIPWLIEKKGESYLLPFGLIFLGLGMSLLMSTQRIELLLIYVSFVSIGMALLTPSLASLISKESHNDNHGVSLGIFSSVNSLAQAIGVLFGGVALIWFTHFSYWLVSFFLFAAAILILIKQRSSRISKQTL